MQLKVYKSKSDEYFIGVGWEIVGDGDDAKVRHEFLGVNSRALKYMDIDDLTQADAGDEISSYRSGWRTIFCVRFSDGKERQIAVKFDDGGISYGDEVAIQPKDLIRLADVTAAIATAILYIQATRK